MPAPAATADQAKLGKLTLRVRGPAGTTQTVVLRSACCRIGAGDGCTLRLRAPGVRDVHCVIFRGPRRTTVRGLAKETWLNGAVFFESELSVGDCLRLGRLEIDVLEDERVGVETAEESSLLAETSTGHSEPGDPETGAAVADGEIADAAASADDTARQLQALVEGQTDALGAAWQAELGRLREELAKCQADLARLGAQTATADRSAPWTRVLDDLRTSQAAWEAWRQHEQDHRASSDAAWRESLAALDRRVQELADAATTTAVSADSPATTAAQPENERAASLGRELETRLAAVERLLEQEREEDAERWQELQQTFARDLSERSAELESQLADLRRGLEERPSREPVRSAGDSGEQASSPSPAPAERQPLSRLLSALRVERDGESRGDERRSEESDELAGTHIISEEERRQWVRAAAENPGQESEAQDLKPEDLKFEQLSHDSPLSTVDVLRRMGATVDDLADDAAVNAPSQPRPQAATPSLVQPRSTARDPQAEAPRGEQHDEGESIEQYMSQLLQRLRTPKPEEGTAPSAPPATPQPAPTPPPTVQRPVAAEVKPSAPAPVEKAPRQPPPELAADLSALRALANNTARQAIDMHHRRGQVRRTRSNLLVAGVALAVSVVLMCYSTGNGLTLWASIASLLVSIYWGGRYFLLTRKLGLNGAAEEKKAAARPTKPAAQPIEQPEAAAPSQGELETTAADGLST